MSRILRAPQGEIRAMMRLAWPALMENLLATMVQFVDTAMVGALGAAATAAVAVNTTPMWLLNGMVVALGVGGTALVARMTGAGDHAGAQSACRQTFIAAAALALILFGGTLAVAGRIPGWMRADPSLHQDAATYMRIIALGFLPHFVGQAMGAVLRGAGDTRTPMRIAMMANILNVIGNYLLIFGPRTLSLGVLRIPMWGAGLGIAGAAISTAVSTALAGLLMIWSLTRSKSRIQLVLARLRPDFALLKRILRIGIPTALERLTINGGQLLFVGMVASLGTAPLAAHHLAITVESLSYMPGYAFGVAATTMVGQALGAGLPEEAKKSGALSIRAGALVMTTIGIALFLLAPVFIAMLTPDGGVREIGAMLIRICAIEQPFMALSLISPAALRGAGDTRTPFLVSLVAMWGVRLCLAWLLVFRLGFGVYGAWAAMVADQAVRGMLLYARFRRGAWTHIKV